MVRQIIAQRDCRRSRRPTPVAKLLSVSRLIDVRAVNFFAEETRMSRSKHQFRPGTPEAFEARVVPTTTAIPGLIPFVPPGQVSPVSSPNDHYDYPNKDNPFAGFFTVSGDTVTTTVTNTDTVGHYVTFAVYNATGGGTGANAVTTGSENLASQNLVKDWDIASNTVFLAPGASTTFSQDLGALKLNGRERVQCDVYEADDASGYAPKKPFEDALNNHLIFGEIFDYDQPNGKR